MRYSHFRRFRVVVFVSIVALTLLFSSDGIAQTDKSSLSGRVVDTKGKPVVGLELAIKPVKMMEHRDMVPRTPFASWSRVITDKEGRFSFHNIDAGSSQFVMFPESASDYEIISLEIGDLTFYSTAFLPNFPTGFGKLTFTIEPGTHLEDVVVNVKPPRMRIRGRVLLKDGTPLVNTNIGLTVRRRQRDTFLFVLPSGGSAGSSGGGTRTDAEGYFVSYYPDEASEYSVIVKYEGASAKSRWFRLKEGQRYDKLVLVLRDLEEHRLRRSERVKARLAVWVVNPENDHAYKRIKCDSWEDAKAKAEAENASLVAINDAAEQKWLSKIFGHRPYWIGLTDYAKEGEWAWESGEPVSFTNWAPHEPMDDDWGDEDFVMMDFSGEWSDVEPNSVEWQMVRLAIIEKDGSTTTPSEEK
jgi:hypothetical protein